MLHAVVAVVNQEGIFTTFLEPSMEIKMVWEINILIVASLAYQMSETKKGCQYSSQVNKELFQVKRVFSFPPYNQRTTNGDCLWQKMPGSYI